MALKKAKMENICAISMAIKLHLESMVNRLSIYCLQWELGSAKIVLTATLNVITALIA
jgi:hypothetical protein